MRVIAMCLFLSWLVLGHVTRAQTLVLPRSALVIGNAAYPNKLALRNSANDAVEVARLLKELGFHVYSGQAVQNANRNGFYDALDAFIAEVQTQRGLALVYFSGHGVEIQGANYLLPIDIVPKSQESVRRDAVALNDIMRRLAGSGVAGAVIILDACRDNELPSFAKGPGEAGLADVKPPDGLFVLYSAAANAKSFDRLNEMDTEQTGVFTRVLLKHIRAQPSSDIRVITQAVRSEVRELARAAKKVQFPSYYDQLDGQFRFTEMRIATASTVKPPSLNSIFESKSASAASPTGVRVLSTGWIQADTQSEQHWYPARGTTLDGNLVMQNRDAIAVVDHHTGNILRRIAAMKDVRLFRVAVDPTGQFAVALGAWTESRQSDSSLAPEPIVVNLRTGESRRLATRIGGFKSFSDVDISPNGRFVALSDSEQVAIYSLEGSLEARLPIAKPPFYVIADDQVRWLSDSLLVYSRSSGLVLVEFDMPRLTRLSDIRLFNTQIRVDRKNMRVAAWFDGVSSKGEEAYLRVVGIDARGGTPIFRVVFEAPVLESVLPLDVLEPMRQKDEVWRISEVAFKDNGDAVWFANRCARYCRGNTAWGTASLKGIPSKLGVFSSNGDTFNALAQRPDGSFLMLWAAEELFVGPTLAVN